MTRELTYEQAISLDNLGWRREEIESFDYIMGERICALSATYPWGAVIAVHCILGYGPKHFIIYKDKMDSFNYSQGTHAIIYADGSGTTSNKSAGVGVVIVTNNNNRYLIAKNIGQGTNNVAELTAIYYGIKEIPSINTELTIYSDSAYAIGSLTEDWNPKVNGELIQKIRDDIAVRQLYSKNKNIIKFVKVKGHSGDPNQELCDALAGWARKYGDKI